MERYTQTRRERERERERGSLLERLALARRPEASRPRVRPLGACKASPLSSQARALLLTAISARARDKTKRKMVDSRPSLQPTLAGSAADRLAGRPFDWTARRAQLAASASSSSGPAHARGPLIARPPPARLPEQAGIIIVPTPRPARLAAISGERRAAGGERRATTRRPAQGARSFSRSRGGATAGRACANSPAGWAPAAA